MIEKCEFYPASKDLLTYGLFCYCSADISGKFVCTKEYSKTCQWANERRQDDIGKKFKEMEEGSA